MSVNMSNKKIFIIQTVIVIGMLVTTGIVCYKQGLYDGWSDFCQGVLALNEDGEVYCYRGEVPTNFKPIKNDYVNINSNLTIEGGVV